MIICKRPAPPDDHPDGQQQQKQQPGVTGQKEKKKEEKEEKEEEKKCKDKYKIQTWSDVGRSQQTRQGTRSRQQAVPRPERRGPTIALTCNRSCFW